LLRKKENLFIFLTMKTNSDEKSNVLKKSQNLIIEAN
jgi:hypothetical protein